MSSVLSKMFAQINLEITSLVTTRRIMHLGFIFPFMTSTNTYQGAKFQINLHQTVCLFVCLLHVVSLYGRLKSRLRCRNFIQVNKFAQKFLMYPPHSPNFAPSCFTSLSRQQSFKAATLISREKTKVLAEKWPKRINQNRKSLF